jgi:hypothetical protein
MIPVVWKQYNCTTSGVVLKRVECEKCRTVYIYQMRRHAQGHGASVYYVDNEGAEERARTEAETALERKLEVDCDAVPCVNCGNYQHHMVQKIKSERYIWLPWLAAFLPFATFILGIFAWVAYSNSNAGATPEHAQICLILAVAAGVVSLIAIVAQIIVSRFDPNAAPVEKRRALGRQLAVTLDEFEQLSTEQKPETTERRRFGARKMRKSRDFRDGKY